MLRSPALINDSPDSRDFIRAPSPDRSTPDSVDLSVYAHEAFYQWEHGTCAAWAAVQFIHIITSRMFNNERGILLSPYDIYYKVRKRMGTFPEDSGSTMRDVLKVLHKDGAIPYKAFPDIQHLSAIPPTVPEHLLFKLSSYSRIQHRYGENAHKLKQILAHEQLPIMIAFDIPEVIINDSTIESTGQFGDLITVSRDEPLIDTYSHAMLITGYYQSNGKTYFKILNSWGKYWGDNGYCYANEDWINYGWIPFVLAT